MINLIQPISLNVSIYIIFFFFLWYRCWYNLYKCVQLKNARVAYGHQWLLTHTHLKSLFIIPKYYTLKSHHYKVILIFNNDNVKNCKYKLSKSTKSIYNTRFWHTSTEVCIKLLTSLKYFQKKICLYVYLIFGK